MSFMSLKLLSTVAAVIGKTKAIEARRSRLAFRVSLCKRLVKTVETVASRKLKPHQHANQHANRQLFGNW